MNSKKWAVLLFVLAVSQGLFPQWNGFFFPPSDISLGEGRIIAAVLFVGGLILWYWKQKEES